VRRALAIPAAIAPMVSLDSCMALPPVEKIEGGSRAASTSCARRSAATRSLQCRPPLSTGRPDSSASPPHSPTRRASGCRRNGRSARSARRRRRAGWGRAYLRSPLRPFHPGRHRRRDDLDAPDLNPKVGPPVKDVDANKGDAAQVATAQAGGTEGPREGAAATFQPALRVPTNEGSLSERQRPQGSHAPPAKPGFSTQESATLRDQLIADPQSASIV